MKAWVYSSIIAQKKKFKEMKRKWGPETFQSMERDCFKRKNEEGKRARKDRPRSSPFNQGKHSIATRIEKFQEAHQMDESVGPNMEERMASQTRIGLKSAFVVLLTFLVIQGKIRVNLLNG